MNDAHYTVVLQGETGARFPLAGSVTVGRHLDNDVVIAGEDVRDFHVRIETGERGPRVVVLQDAIAHRNQIPVDGSVGMRPGDELVLGHHRLRLDMETTTAPCDWKLYRIGDGLGVAITSWLSVGRASDCDLQLAEGHLSRHHAELVVIGGTIWLEDLRSANGTFLNGDRVIGARRLYHGDEVAFDAMRYQLIGDAPDLTPIRPPGQPPDQLGDAERELLDARLPPSESADATTHPSLAVQATPTTVTPPVNRSGGPALVGRSAPFAGHVFPLAFGRHVIGRGPDADIELTEASVSLRHAELELRTDGAHLVNLIPTNGTRVNDAPIHAARLNDGDSIRVGRVTLQYFEAATARSRISRKRVVWIATAVVVGLLALVVTLTH